MISSYRRAQYKLHQMTLTNNFFTKYFIELNSHFYYFSVYSGGSDKTSETLNDDILNL